MENTKLVITAEPCFTQYGMRCNTAADEIFDTNYLLAYLLL